MSTNNSSDQRRKERREVDQLIKVKDSLMDADLGKVVNLNDDGFMLIGNGAINENCLYQLVFTFAKPVNDIFHIALGAECLWLNETDAGDQSWAGFQIIDIAENDQKILESLIKEIAQ